MGVDSLDNILANMLKEKENKLLKLNIPEIKEWIELFKRLDEEYKLYAENTSGIFNHIMFSPKFIKNKNWRGLWYRANGTDYTVYVSWLSLGIESDSEIDLLSRFKESHPRERYIPYSIVLANNTLLHIKKGKASNN